MIKHRNNILIRASLLGVIAVLLASCDSGFTSQDRETLNSLSDLSQHNEECQEEKLIPAQVRPAPDGRVQLPIIAIDPRDEFRARVFNDSLAIAKTTVKHFIPDAEYIQTGSPVPVSGRKFQIHSKFRSWESRFEHMEMIIDFSTDPVSLSAVRMIERDGRGAVEYDYDRFSIVDNTKIASNK